MLFRPLPIIALCLGSILVALPLGAQSHDNQQTARPRAAAVSVGPLRRMLISAPHPDDELLAAGGIIHYYSWPFEDDAPRIPPPDGLSGGVSGWLNVPLSAADVKTKRAALALYKS